MSASNQVVSLSKRGMDLLLARTDAWRRPFLLYRVLFRAGVNGRRLAKTEFRLLETLSNNPKLLQPLIAFYDSNGLTNKADEIVSEFESRNIQQAEWYLAFAAVWFHRKQWQRGDVALAEAERLNPELTEIYELEARTSRIRGNSFRESQAARTVLQRQVKNSNEWREWAEYLSVSEHKLGNYQTVVDLLEELQPKYFSHWHTNFRYAHSLEQVGQDNAAEEQYAMTLSEFRPKAPINHARAKLKGEFRYVEQSLEDYSSADASTLTPYDWYTRGVMHARLEQWEFARESFENACTRGLVKRIKAEGQYYLGCTLEIQERYIEAIDVYSKAALTARRSKKKEVFTYRLAVCQHKIGNTAEALKSFQNIWKSRAASGGATVVELENILDCASKYPNVSDAAINLGAKLAVVDPENAIEAYKYVRQQRTPDVYSLTVNWDNTLEFGQQYLELVESAKLDENLVFIESFLGRRVSCNPLALLREALCSAETAHLRFVVSVQKDTSVPEDILRNKRVSFVLRNSYGYLRALATAKFLINNTTFPRYFTRKDGQRYLNTWHGIPWKTLGKDISDQAFSYGNVVRNMLIATDLTFPDKHSQNVLINRQGIGGLCTANQTVTGSPRLDRVIRPEQDILLKIRTEILTGCNSSKGIVLYAPTWRDWAEKLDNPAKEFIEIVNVVSEQLPEYTIAVRGHHFLESALDELHGLQNVRVVPPQFDTNDLLPACDYLISDYSSVIFDFAVLGRPILKITHDEAKYRAERGLYFGSESIPGETCNSLEFLPKALKTLVSTPPQDYTSFGFSSFEDGYAASRIWKMLLENLPTREESSSAKLLLSVSGLNPNGITRSLRNLVHNLSSFDLEIHVFSYAEVFRNPAVAETVEELGKSVNLLIDVGGNYGTKQEIGLQNYFNVAEAYAPISRSSIQASQMNREFHRRFGDADFDAVIEFDGYNPGRTRLLMLGSRAKRKIHVLHNDFFQEATKRFPKLKAAMRTLTEADVIASVSVRVMHENIKFLETFGVSESNHMLLRNTLNVQSILKQSHAPLSAEFIDHFRGPRKHIVVSGRLSPEKNHFEFVEAFASLDTGTRNSLDVLILGDGPLRSALQTKIAQHHLQKHISLAGFQGNPYPFVRAADAFFLPSNYEGQPIVLLEALTIATPVIATDIPGSRSVLRNGELGTLVEKSHRGIAEGLKLIAKGLPSMLLFEAEKYNDEVVDDFLELAGLR
ncbi:MAG: CDP-glycerol glycerophosphotransferase family protein [Canibacter sp.]